MVEPTALADTVTPPIFSPAGDVTGPVRIDGSAAKAAFGTATLASNDSASAAPVVRLAAKDKMEDDKMEDMASSPVGREFQIQRGGLALGAGAGSALR